MKALMRCLRQAPSNGRLHCAETDGRLGKDKKLSEPRTDFKCPML